jgi:hypothetical protein
MRWLSALIVIVVSACVSQADFDKHAKSVKESGDAVDVWIGQAQKVLDWVAVNAATFCPSCSGPTPPPPPPPDGDWGS